MKRLAEITWTFLHRKLPFPENRNIPPLLVILIAASAGIYTDRVSALPLEIWLLLAFSFWLGWLTLWLSKMDEGASVFLLASTASCFAAHHHIWWRYYPADEISFFAVSAHPMVCVRGIVVEEPRIQPPPPPNPMDLPRPFPTTILSLWATAIRNGNRWQPTTGQVSLYVQGELRGLYAGDVVEVYGHLYGPPVPSNPGETDFGQFRRTHRRLATLQADHPNSVVKIDRVSYFSPRLLLGRIRGYHTRKLEEMLSASHREIAAAVLLGIREGIDPELSLAFFETSTLHLLAISGLHVGLLAVLARGIGNLFFFRWRWVVITIATCVLVYITLAETRPSVVRAGTLVLLGCLSYLLARQALSFNLLGATGLVLLMVNPAQLFQAGTHLTFLATAAILWYDRSPLAVEGTVSTRWLLVPPGRLARMWTRFLQLIHKAFLLNIWVWLIVTPYLVTKFHVFPILAPLLTVPLLPILTIILATAIAALMIGWILPLAATPFAWICDIATSLFAGVVQESRRVPYSYFWLAGPPSWWTTGFYAILALLAVTPFLRRHKRWVLVLSSWMVVGILVPLVQPPESGFRCTFVSVGHGLLTVLQPPNGPAILYDAGSMRPPHHSGPQVCQVLWALGVRRVGGIILSHGDRDHYNLVPEIARRFPVERVFAGPQLASALGEKFSAAPIDDCWELRSGRTIVLPRRWYHALPALRWSGNLRVPRTPVDSPDNDSPGEEDNQQAEQGVQALCHFLTCAGIPISVLWEGDTLILEGSDLRLRVLAAPTAQQIRGKATRKSATDNACSMVIAAEFAGKRILLTGDLEPPGTDRLFARPPVPCDVVLAPHHGSRSSNPAGIVEWANPSAVVISGSRQWFRADVVVAYRRAGITVFHTLLDGATRIEVLKSEHSQDPSQAATGKINCWTFRRSTWLELNSHSGSFAR